MIRLPNIFYSPDAGGGDGGAEPAAGGEHWTSQHAYFQQNPDAIKSFKDFKTPDDAFKAHVELRKQQSQPFRLPKDGAKLTAEQQAEFRSALAKYHGVPDSPEGYEFEVPEDVALHEPTMQKYRALLHERGVDPQTAKDVLALQVGMVKELNAHRDRVIQGMTDNNYKTFLNEDCAGDKDVASSRLEMVKKYLQTQCKDKDGNPDPKAWEGFAARIMHGDRIIELPLLRALVDAAQMKVGTGGAPGGYGDSFAPSGKKLYAEMTKT